MNRSWSSYEATWGRARCVICRLLWRLIVSMLGRGGHRWERRRGLINLQRTEGGPRQEEGQQSDESGELALAWVSAWVVSQVDGCVW